MKRYFETFKLVELNSTFYEYPRLETVRGWRERALEGFEFTVKVHQDVTHGAKMKVCDASLDGFRRMKEICAILDAKVLLFQTPGSFRADGLEDAAKLFRRVKHEGELEDLVFVWETRGPSWETAEAREKLGAVLAELNVVHVVDPLRLLPAYVSDVAYFRLHGLGKRMYYYQYCDDELRRLADIVKSYDVGGRSVYVLFNNLAMLEDSRRFLEFLARGRFPRLTAGVGVDSVREVLAKVRFPVSKNVLMNRFGWRLVEIGGGRQVRLDSVLDGLPQKSFESLDELLIGVKERVK